MDISILIPTCYKSINKLRMCLDYIFDNSDSKDSIEVIFRIDDNDSIENVIDSYSFDHADYNIVKITGKRHGYKYHYKYMNELASVAKGDFLLPFADDCFIHTKNWDLLLREFLGKPSILRASEIYHIKHAGTLKEYKCTPKTNICPIVNRLIYDQLGHLSPVIAYDSWIDDIARRTNIEEIIDMKITHFKTTNELRHFRRKQFFDSKSLLDGDVKKIKKFIRNYKQKD